MPNWCSNVLHIKADSKKLEAIKKAVENEESFAQVIRPMPSELEGTESPTDEPNWYDWQVSNWGCKWGDSEAVLNEDGDGLTIHFSTPWCPMIELYKFMEDNGYIVEAYYFEPGMCFYGSYINGDDFWEEYSSAEDINGEIDEIFGISEFLEECEEA